MAQMTPDEVNVGLFDRVKVLEKENHDLKKANQEMRELLRIHDEGETFDEWWNRIGSKIRPLEREDQEEHAGRVSRLAWMKGRREI